MSLGYSLFSRYLSAVKRQRKHNLSSYNIRYQSVSLTIFVSSYSLISIRTPNHLISSYLLIYFLTPD